MDSVNTFPAVQGSAPNSIFNYLSAAGNESGDQGDLFAAILSQTQSVAPQSPPDAANIQNQPPVIQQSPQNNTTNTANSTDAGGTNNAGSANGTAASGNAGAASNAPDMNGGNGANSENASNDNNAANSNGNLKNSNANASSQAVPHGTKSGRPPIGKLSRRSSKTGNASTNTAAITAGNTPSLSPKVQAAANGVAIAGNSNTDPSSGTTTVPPAEPVSSPNARTEAAAILPLNSGAPAGALAGSKTPSPDSGPAANNDPSPNADAALNSGLILNADPKTGNAAPVAGNGDNNAADPATPASAPDGTTSSHLMLLLMQLEHLAAGQTATQTASVDPQVADGGQTSSTGPTQQAAAPNGDQGKIDLKALMSAIAKLEGGVTNGENIDPQDGGDAANGSPNGVSSSSSSSASSQSTAPAWGNAPSNADSKWISPDFLNLFSLPANNVGGSSGAPTPSPVLFAAGAIAGTSTGDGAALDTGTQGQTNAGVRDNALLSTNSSLPPAMGSAQAANPYDFASQLSALRATQGGATGLPAPIDQVILQLSRNLTSDGSSQMSIQLRPAELGRVDVKLTIGSDGKVQGTVTADNPSTLNLLLKDVRGLERALQEAGLRADSGSLQFGLRGDGQANGGSGQTAGNSTAFDDDTVSSSGAAAILPGFAGPAETYYLTPGGVNMRV